MKKFRINVLTMRKYLLFNYLVVGCETEKEVRNKVWCWLAQHGYLDKELFYKLEVKEVNE